MAIKNCRSSREATREEVSLPSELATARYRGSEAAVPPAALYIQGQHLTAGGIWHRHYPLARARTMPLRGHPGDGRYSQPVGLARTAGRGQVVPSITHRVPHGP